jgi:hypothetical protein
MRSEGTDMFGNRKYEYKEIIQYQRIWKEHVEMMILDVYYGKHTITVLREDVTWDDIGRDGRISLISLERGFKPSPC